MQAELDVTCSDENNKIYQTLLQSQLLNVQNPHLITGSKLNDSTTELGVHEIKSQETHKILNFSENSHQELSPYSFDVPAFSGFEEE